MGFRFTILVVLSFFVVSQGLTQSFYAVRQDRDLIGSVGIGTSTYFGEFQNPKNYIDAKPSISIGAQVFPAPYFIGDRLAVRAELSWFRLQGSDANANDDRVVRNLSFYSNNIELNVVGAIHAMPQHIKYYRIFKRSTINIYGLVGAGILYTNPKTEYQGKKVALQPLQTEGINYTRFQFVIPYGLGISYKTNSYYNIILEGVWRKTFTDYLDDASSTRYLDPALLGSDLSRALSDRRKEREPSYVTSPGRGRRGNPDKKDSYMLINIKVEYYLPVKLGINDRRYRRSKRS